MSTTKLAKTKTSFKEKNHKNLVGILFLLPTIILMLLFKYVPIGIGIFGSFFKLTPTQLPGDFIGFDNYIHAFKDPIVYQSLLVNLKMALYSTFMNFWTPILCAVLINEVRGKKQALYRLMYFIPAVTPAVAGSILWKYIWNPQYGIANALMGALGIPDQLWLNDVNLVYFCMHFPGLIICGGMNMVIFLSALQNVSQELYEAAVLDGAGIIKRVRYITLPTIKDTIGTMYILAMIGFFNACEGPMLLTGGGPGTATTPVLLYAYKMANAQNYGYAVTIATLVFFLVLILTALVQRISKKD